MKQKALVGIMALAGLALLAGTPQVPGAIGTRWFGYDAVVGYTQWVLVGTTTSTHLGDAGVRTMNDACRAEFPMSRMCSSVEVIESVPTYPFSSSEAAWVRPVLEGTDGNGAIIDSSGLPGSVNVAYSYALSCGGWSGAAGGHGLVVDSGGSFQRGECYVARPVTCCALIQVPEPAQNSGLIMGIAALGLLRRRRYGLDEALAACEAHRP